MKDKKPRKIHPMSLPKSTPALKKAFAEKQFRPKWHNHPIKDQILAWVEDGFSARKIEEKIQLKATEDGKPIDDYSLSLPTVVKIRRRHLRSIGALKKEEVQSRLKTIADNEFGGVEKVLLKTIDDCTKKKSDPTISPKDWQYFDQQQQSAIQLLNNLRAEGKSGEDVAVVISRVFSQFFRQWSSNPAGAQSPPPPANDDSGPKEDKPL